MNHIFHNRTHDSLHQQLGLDNIVTYHRDYSCPRCYPPEQPSIEFHNFWNWISTNYPAISYSRYSQQFLEELYYTPHSGFESGIQDLLFSIRYADIDYINYTTLRQNFINEYFLTSGFQPDPNEYQVSETTTSPGSTTGSIYELDTSDEEEERPAIEYNTPFNSPLNLTGSSESSDSEDNNMANPAQADFQNLTAALRALAQALPNTNNAVQNLQNALPGVNNALVANTNALANQPRESRVADLPTYYGGNQDPVAWLEEFTRACNANGLNNNRKLQVVPAYLKGPASTWWTTNQALANGNANRITAWTGNNNNTDFTANFPAQFRSQTLIEIWSTELERRRQQPGESVSTYAAALQELYRRVEDGAFQYPEALKARKFVNGLLPDLYVTVKPHNDQTWQAATNRAKSYELTHQDHQAVTAYLNKFAPSSSDTQAAALQTAIQELTNKIQQLGNNNQRNFRRNNNPNFTVPNAQPQLQQQPRRLICYLCGQPGHMRRNCPNLNATVPPRNNTAVPPVVNNTAPPNNVFTNTNAQPNDNQQLMQLLAQLIPQGSNDATQSLN
jgi:Retrotransposon gag protein/Zinc knuckle